MRYTDHRNVIYHGVKVALVLFWGGVIVYVAVVSASESPYIPTKSVKINLMAVSPQGWEFFTRDPREPERHVFRRNVETWEEIDRANFSSRNLFGIKRTSILEQVEIKSMMSQVADSAWVSCDGTLSECINEKKLRITSVQNNSQMGLLCGDHVIQDRRPVPWAWSGDAEPSMIPSKVVRLSISCPIADN